MVEIHADGQDQVAVVAVGERGGDEARHDQHLVRQRRGGLVPTEDDPFSQNLDDRDPPVGIDRKSSGPPGRAAPFQRSSNHAGYAVG